MEGWWGDSPERKNYKNTRELLQWQGDGMGGLNAGSGEVLGGGLKALQSSKLNLTAYPFLFKQ